MNNISAIVLTKNNESSLQACLQSLQGLFDELIIIDDYSSDSSLEIARQEFKEVKIIKRKLDRFDTQRNEAIKNASYNWILMIDSDEIISETLKLSIKQEEDNPEIDAYWVVRQNRFFSVYLPEKHQERPILFRKQLRFKNPVHEILVIDKKRTKKLSGDLIHEGWQGISANMKKMDAYSSLIAQRWQEEKRNYPSSLLYLFALILPIRYFFVCLIIKKFYRAGLCRGIFYSLFESSWWLAVIFKYQELRKKEKNEQ